MKELLSYYSGDIVTNTSATEGVWDGEIFITPDGRQWGFDSSEGDPRVDGSGVHYLFAL